MVRGLSNQHAIVYIPTVVNIFVWILRDVQLIWHEHFKGPCLHRVRTSVIVQRSSSFMRIFTCISQHLEVVRIFHFLTGGNIFGGWVHAKDLVNCCVAILWHYVVLKTTHAHIIPVVFSFSCLERLGLVSATTITKCSPSGRKTTFIFIIFFFWYRHSVRDLAFLGEWATLEEEYTYHCSVDEKLVQTLGNQ